jgi:hypothetical protein
VIADNEIDGNLQCKSNNPPPAGENNRVQGNKEDQCANLRPESGSGGSAPSPTAVAADSPGSGGGSMGALVPCVLLLLRLLRPARARATRLFPR